MARLHAPVQRPARVLEGSASTAPLRLTPQDIAAARAGLSPLQERLLLWRYAGDAGARLKEEIELMAHLRCTATDRPRPKPSPLHVERLAELLLLELAGEQYRRWGSRRRALYVGVSEPTWRRRWREDYQALAARVWQLHDEAAMKVIAKVRSTS